MADRFLPGIVCLCAAAFRNVTIVASGYVIDAALV